MNCIQDEKNNKIYGNPGSGLRVNLLGSGNILWIDEDARFDKDSRITFNGNNSIVYLGGGRNLLKLDVFINHNCTFAIGRNNYINGTLTVVVSEETNILIGDEGLFSFGLYLRTADPHLIYDCETHQRINPSKDILIGDHVWIGQDALVLKGTQLGSGCILGAGSVISNKIVTSNSSFAGNPARKVRDGIFWNGSSVHAWTQAQTQARSVDESTDWIYAPTAEAIDIGQILATKYDSEARFRVITELYQGSGAVRERFSIAPPAPPPPPPEPKKSFWQKLFRR